MATRISESKALAERCRAVGWRVESSKDGWKVWIPNVSIPRVIHRTYGDVWSLKLDVQEFERGGLVRAEEKQRKDELAARAKKLTEQREAADRKAEQIAASQQGAISRAAGPYLTEPKECDLGWLTTPHPAPWMEWMYITPKAAAALLEDYNGDNRKLSPTISDRYAKIILSGQWHMTHQGLAIDTRGIVQDGQHRLRGVQLAGDTDEEVQVPFAVFVGMPQDNFKAIDEGRLRSASQMLTKAGESNGGHIGTVVKLSLAYRESNPREFVRQKLGNAAIFAEFERDADAYRRAVAWGSKHYKKTQCTPGVLGAAHYLLYRLNGADNPYVTAFLEGFAYSQKYGTQLVLPVSDPRKVLRNKFTVGRPAAIEGLFWFIHAWNNLVQGRHPQHMRLSEATAPPQILVCKPGQGVTPRALVGEDLDERATLVNPFARGEEA